MYKVKATLVFKREIKKLGKKYLNIKKDVSDLLEQLKQGIFEGDQIQGFTGNVYKVRVASIDQKKGKSGGFRVIYYVITEGSCVYLLSIYAKAKKENIHPKEIQAILNEIKE